ncbi:MAG: IS701 family transposase, partial [Acidobacteria bacterium]|nr:IS701 family transposase [Acidobacteriota bacterium]
ARVHPQNVRSAHQSMHHLVADAEWNDRAVLGAVAQQVVPELLKRDQQCWWILDDTAHLKKGQHSVGVARQYCGRVGKTDNCQVAVSLSLANTHGSVPLDYRLYLPREWTQDRRRRGKAGVAPQIEFRSKVQIAREEIQAALSAGIARGMVLADAWYGNEADFRDWLCCLQMQYVLGVRANTSVWWGKHQPVQSPGASGGRPRQRLQRDARHQPVSVLQVARALGPASWRTVTWREGTKEALSSRFARVRVRAAHDHLARAEEWLLIEWPAAQAEPSHYWLSTLPYQTSFKQLVFNAMGRWMIERDYEELKSELGLSHYEGRNWRGFHHHATLCIAAYGFLMLERLRGKKNTARFTAPALPKNFRPRGSASAAASQSVVDRHRALQARPRDRSYAPTVPVLRETVA